METQSTRIVLCGTYPNISSGYAKITSQICKHLGAYTDIELFMYGIHKGEQDVRSVNFGPRVHLHDATGNEKKPSDGFGMFELAAYVKETKPDIVILYNDLYVIKNWIYYLEQGLGTEYPRPKIVLYLDMFYKNFYTHYIDMLNTKVDHIFVFSDYWRDYLVDELHIKPPVEILYHGFSRDIFIPQDRNTCRKTIGLPPNAFIILNLNRNLTRKRPDIFVMAVAKLLVKNPKEDIYIVVNSNKEAFFDIFDLLHNSLLNEGCCGEEITTHMDKLKIMVKAFPDTFINELYNASDIGVNTCQGEGWGLTAFEHLALGKPQVVSAVGAMDDFISNEYSIKIQPKASIYLGAHEDAIGGRAEIVDYNDVYMAMEYYLHNPSIRDLHGQRGRKAILENPDYTWKNICTVLHDSVIKVSTKRTPPLALGQTCSVQILGTA